MKDLDYIYDTVLLCVYLLLLLIPVRGTCAIHSGGIHFRVNIVGYVKVVTSQVP